MSLVPAANSANAMLHFMVTSSLWSVMVPFVPIPFRRLCHALVIESDSFDSLCPIPESLQFPGWFFFLFAYSEVHSVSYTCLGFIRRVEGYICYHSSIQNSFITPQIPLCSPVAIKPSYFLKSLAANDLFSVSVILPFLKCHRNGITQYVALYHLEKCM